MIEHLSHFEFLVVAGGLLGFWLKHQSDFTTLKSRVKVLESDNSVLKSKIDVLLTEIQEIKVLLAKNQVQ
jgi:hypothetical protein